MHRIRKAYLFCLFISFVGCDSGAQKSQAAVESTCKGADDELPAEVVCLQTVSGRIVDVQQQPVAGQQVTVCGPICFIGETQADGAFTISIDRFVLANEYSVQPHGRPSRSSYYFQFPDDFQGGDYDAGNLVAFELAEGEALITWRDDPSGPSQSVQSAGFRLEVPEGVQVRPDIGDLLLGEQGQKFAALELSEVDAVKFDPFLEGKLTFALAPFETRFSSVEDAQQGARVGFSIENIENWPAESAVDVFALGTYLDAAWLTPAKFELIGQALVSSDEKTIVFTPDPEQPGLQHLTWVALDLSK